MTKLMGYWTDLGGLKFSEDRSSWIQLMPLGKYDHPLYGEINFTPSTLQRYADNFDNNVRETEIDIDYDHKVDTSKAAGWLKAVEVRPDGLFGLVEWTAAAAQALTDGEYRYFSPEFADEWTHPKTGVIYKNVLMGGGITNRPFLKDILPVNLSEVVNHSRGGNLMDPKALRKLLGLTEDATDEAVTAELDKLPEGVRTQITTASSDSGDGSEDGSGGDQNDDGDQNDSSESVDNEAVLATLAEHEKALKKLGETDPAVAKLLTERAEDRKRLVALEMSNRLSEVRIKLSEIDKGKKYSLSPNVRKLAEETVMNVSPKAGDAFLKLLADIVNDGLVPVTEHGGGRPTIVSGDATKQFGEKADAIMQANEKLNPAEAMERLMETDPDLYAAYRAAQLEGAK